MNVKKQTERIKLWIIKKQRVVSVVALSCCCCMYVTWKKRLSPHCLQRTSERGLFWQYFSYTWSSSFCPHKDMSESGEGLKSALLFLWTLFQLLLLEHETSVCLSPAGCWVCIFRDCYPEKTYSSKNPALCIQMHHEFKSDCRIFFIIIGSI